MLAQAICAVALVGGLAIYSAGGGEPGLIVLGRFFCAKSIDGYLTLWPSARVTSPITASIDPPVDQLKTGCTMDPFRSSHMRAPEGCLWARGKAETCPFGYVPALPAAGPETPAILMIYFGVWDLWGSFQRRSLCGGARVFLRPQSLDWW